KIVWIEELHPLEHLAIVIIEKMIVPILAMLGIEGMVAKHVQARLRDVVFHHLVDILIMSPRHAHVAQAAVWRVHTILIIRLLVVLVGVEIEELGIYNLV